MSKIGHITIEVSLPDDADLQDLEALARIISKKALTDRPVEVLTEDWRVCGKVVHYGWFAETFRRGGFIG